jgi:hypothetical protein
MSKFAEEVYKVLRQIFPFFTITKEHYVKYKNTRLFFDFWVRELNLFFEVQGQQHQEYNQHFHGDINGFRASKKRDNLKKEWIEKYDHHLVEIFPNDKIEKFYIMRKIYKEIGYEMPKKKKRRKKKKVVKHDSNSNKGRNPRTKQER